MRIDQTHHSWAVASVTILIVAIIVYIPYIIFHPGGANGNSWPGLVYGAAGYCMMLYAGLMGARKKVPLWRIGRAQIWMRGHLWLGALSFPMILLHAGFRARGPLTLVLMVLMTIVVLSGISGALLQHFVPKRLTSMVQLETIYEQIPEVREQLQDEASSIVDQICGDNTAVAMLIAAGAVNAGAGPAGVLADKDKDEDAPDLTDDQRANLRFVYRSGILPFLRNPDDHHSPLRDKVKAGLYFDALRRQSPPAVHEAITDLESICEEERQLIAQRRTYLLLHSWLLAHVPLSVTLLVLGGIHAFVAIHY